MSVQRKQKTDMNDKSSVVQALKDLGYKPVVQDKKKIRGHADELSDEGCEIVLRKEDTVDTKGNKRGADIGFSQQADGSFTVITDTWVNKDINIEEFSKTVKVAYVKAHGRKIAKKNNLVFKGERTLANGKTRMVFATA